MASIPQPVSGAYGLPRSFRVLITVFMLFNAITFALWTAPLNFPLLQKYKTLVAPYLLWTGLFQAWDMFSPDPLRMNAYLTGTVTYRNGTVREWIAPRMDQLGYFSRYQKERYRKFMLEHLWLDAQSGLWHDGAVHLAREFNTDPANPPVNVRLTRNWSIMQPPGPNGEFRSDPWSHYTFYSYDVQPEDLR